MLPIVAQIPGGDPNHRKYRISALFSSMSRSRRAQAAPKPVSSSSEGPSIPLYSTPTFTIGPLGKHAAYVKQLSKKYEALAKVMHDEPASPPRIGFSESDQEHRIYALRERVKEAWVNADGNPADGKWAFLSRLLQMGSTNGRRGRWIGARPDVKTPEQLEGHSLGWLNAKSEGEWKEWERKFNQERRVKEKVESWKRRVDVEPGIEEEIVDDSVDGDAPRSSEVVRNALVSYTSDDTTNTKVASDANNRKKALQENGRATDKATAAPSKPVVKTSSSGVDPLKDTAPFGFGVVKRPSQQSVVNGKPSAGTSKFSNGVRPPTSPKAKEKVDLRSSANNQSLKKSGSAANAALTKDIRDISELPDLVSTCTLI